MAHRMTTVVARLLGNRDYRIALGQLSDYEATNKLPRHMGKVMSLCVVYGIHPLDLLAAAGVRVDDSDKAPMSLQDASHDRFTSAYLSDRYFGSRSDFAEPRPQEGTRLGDLGATRGRARAVRAGA